MKGKILTMLVVLALVFGIVLVSCDNGTNPTAEKSTVNNKVLDDKAHSTYGDWVIETLKTDGSIDKPASQVLDGEIFP